MFGDFYVKFQVLIGLDRVPTIPEVKQGNIYMYSGY